MIEINDIKEILRHRYPFLLIDRVIEIEEGKRAKGIKNVTINEPFFNGHFPEFPIMPGVLILEAMSQLAGALAGKGKRINGFLSSIYSARFSKQVIPGDQLILEVEITQKVKNLIRVKATAQVDGKRVAKAELGFMVFDENEIKGIVNE